MDSHLYSTVQKLRFKLPFKSEEIPLEYTSMGEEKDLLVCASFLFNFHFLYCWAEVRLEGILQVV